MSKTSLYIVWAKFQRRAISMEKTFDFDIVYLPTGGRSKAGKLLSYMQRTANTFTLLLRHRPETVWVQCPPNFILLFSLLYRAIVNREARIVADCHNASLRSPWITMPLSLVAINHCDAVLVHNAEVAEQAVARGVRRELILVLEDAPAYAESGIKQGGSIPQDYILVPCSFHDDEPLDDLLVAAASLPDVQFKITGPKAKAECLGYVERAPTNVTFTGFISEAEYDALVFGAGAILGLTTVEGVQLSVAGEALGAGRPLVLSDTRILREMFSGGAHFTRNDAASLAISIRYALTQRDEMARKSYALAQLRFATWLEHAVQIKRRLLDCKKA